MPSSQHYEKQRAKENRHAIAKYAEFSALNFAMGVKLKVVESIYLCMVTSMAYVIDVRLNKKDCAEKNE